MAKDIQVGAGSAVRTASPHAVADQISAEWKSLRNDMEVVQKAARPLRELEQKAKGWGPKPPGFQRALEDARAAYAVATKKHGTEAQIEVRQKQLFFVVEAAVKRAGLEEPGPKPLALVAREAGTSNAGEAAWLQRHQLSNPGVAARLLNSGSVREVSAFLAPLPRR